MSKPERQAQVETLSATIEASPNIYVTDFAGLDVAKMTEFRRRLRAAGARYVVVKNTLAMRAAKQTKLEQLEPYFQGPTAVAYHPKDLVGMAKLLTEISKGNPNFQFKAALVEGKVVPASEIQAIASMPSREVMLSKLVFLLKAPLQRLAMTLKAPARNLDLVLQQIKK